MLEERCLWFWLSNVNGIGRKKMQDLLEFYQMDLGQIFTADQESLSKIPSLTEKDVAYLSQHHEEDVVKRAYERLQKEQVEMILQTDKHYPKRLMQLFDAPYVLYVKGRLPDQEKPSLAIVGSRECTNYGREVAMFFARELARKGVQIISGLAMGIDGYGHMGALQEKGYTLGILGCGINVCYPKSNWNIYNNIVESGGIMSEYGYNVKPHAGNFPMRNRLIAAMSDAIFVIEARERSGSFITVDQGLELGKDIFIIPGRITDDLSAGCNRLARMGASVVCHPKDILEYYKIADETVNPIGKERWKDTFSKEENQVLDCLSMEPVCITKIVSECKLTIGNVSGILLKLETNGVVRQITKNYYAIRL